MCHHPKEEKTLSTSNWREILIKKYSGKHKRPYCFVAKLTCKRKHKAYCWVCVWIGASSPLAGKWWHSKPAHPTELWRSRWESWWCLRTEGQWPGTSCTCSKRWGRTSWAAETGTQKMNWTTARRITSCNTFLVFVSCRTLSTSHITVEDSWSFGRTTATSLSFC